MKVISPLSGAVAIRVPIEEIMPKTRIPLPNLIAALSERYTFTSMNEIAPNQPISLQNGKADILGNNLVFIQLLLMQGGDIVYSSDTATAELIMDDLTGFFKDQFGYKFELAQVRKFYLSAVVVEFDGARKNLLSSLSLFEKKIADFGGAGMLKRLSFGRAEHDPGQPALSQMSPLDSIENAEFLIERRLGSDPSLNRFFSTAPFKTEQHIELLESIEAIGGEDFY